MDRAMFSQERRLRPFRIEDAFRCFVFRDDDGRRGITQKDSAGRVIRPARVANLLAYMAEARAHKHLHDYLTYRERLRAMRQGRAERQFPLGITLEGAA